MKTYRMLDVVSAELATAVVTVEQIQEGLSPALSPSLLDHPEAVVGLQELDRLTQTLHSLARVLSSLSEAVDQSHTMDPGVLALVNLERLAARLLATGDNTVKPVDWAEADEGVP